MWATVVIRGARKYCGVWLLIRKHMITCLSAIICLIMQSSFVKPTYLRILKFFPRKPYVQLEKKKWDLVFMWHHFQPKTENFFMFWLFIIYTTTRPGNSNFWKQVLKCTFLKTIPSFSLCKLQKWKFVKTMSCTCVLYVLQSVQVQSSSLQSDISNTESKWGSFWQCFQCKVFGLAKQ